MGYSLGDVLLVVAATPFIKLADSIEEKKKKEERIKRLRATLRPESEKEMVRGLTHLVITKTSYAFKKFKDPNAPSINFKGYEHTKFDPDKDKIFHGIVYVTKLDKNGKKIGEEKRDIYTYQPRFDGANDVNVGPKYTSDGGLKSDIAYCYKDHIPDSKDKNLYVYTAAIPKREILSDDIFDFDTNCKANYEATCQKIFGKDKAFGVRVEYDKNSKGLLKPVDLKNKNELEKLNEYLRQYRKTDVTDKSFNDWEAFANQCRYELGVSKTKTNILYSAVRSSDRIISYINLIKDNEEILKEQDRQFQEEMARIRYSARQASKELQEAKDKQDKEEAAKKKTEETIAENAKMTNDYIKYGYTSTVSSPLSRGGMAPGVGGGMHGGPGGGPGGAPSGGPMGGPGPGMHR